MAQYIQDKVTDLLLDVIFCLLLIIMPHLVVLYLIFFTLPGDAGQENRPRVPPPVK